MFETAIAPDFQAMPLVDNTPLNYQPTLQESVRPITSDQLGKHILESMLPSYKPVGLWPMKEDRERPWEVKTRILPKFDKMELGWNYPFPIPQTKKSEPSRELLLGIHYPTEKEAERNMKRLEEEWAREDREKTERKKHKSCDGYQKALSILNESDPKSIVSAHTSSSRDYSEDKRRSKRSKSLFGSMTDVLDNIEREHISPSCPTPSSYYHSSSDHDYEPSTRVSTSTSSGKGMAIAGGTMLAGLAGAAAITAGTFVPLIGVGLLAMAVRALKRKR